jgi:hypothetical protein
MMMLVAGLAVAAGCVPSGLTTPADYVRLATPPYPYVYKAVSAEGVSLAMRQEENPEGGTAEFWAAALKNQLVGARGYTLSGESAVTSADGVTGKRLDFTANLQGSDMAYLVAVWVVGKQIIIVEAGGPKEKFEADRAKIETALKTVRAKS